LGSIGGKNIVAMTLWSWARVYGAPIQDVVVPTAMPTMYSCILLRKHSVPRAILFEPDRRNLIRPRANLLMNGLLEPSRLNEFQ
ncbi:MAG: hypothetical protein WCD69_17255, partial [Xanthobacteraceae bacterium]